MKDIFKETKKAEAFDFLIEEYFKQGFGSLNKSDTDLLFYTTLIKYGDNKDDSDYSISKLLKITQQRVRSLKVKSVLKYPSDNKIEYYSQLFSKIKSAQINGDKISIGISDPNLFIELEHIIETHDGFVDLQLNPKIFSVSIDNFLNLLLYLSTINKDDDKVEKIKKAFVEEAKKKIKQNESLLKEIDIKGDFSFDDFKKSMVKIGVDKGVEFLCSFVPGGNFLAEPAKMLVTQLRNKLKK